MEGRAGIRKHTWRFHIILYYVFEVQDIEQFSLHTYYIGSFDHCEGHH